jgi:hypothetical protein
MSAPSIHKLAIQRLVPIFENITETETVCFFVTGTSMVEEKLECCANSVKVVGTKGIVVFGTVESRVP